MVIPVKASFDVEGVTNPYKNPNPVPDFMRIHEIIKEAYRDDGVLDTFEIEDLERVGLDHRQARLVQETIFNPLETSGYLTSEEGGRYDKAGLGELKRMLDWESPEAPLEVTYVGVGGAEGLSLYLNDPSDFSGPYPNDWGIYKGFGVAIGIGQGRQEIGELLLTYRQGSSSDRIDPNDFAIQDAVDQLEKGVNDEVDQGEKDLEGQINEQVEKQTGIDPDIDLKTEDVQIEPEQTGINELKFRRRARHSVGMISWRFPLPLNGISIFDDRVRILKPYLSLGLGYMHTETDVTKGSQNKKERRSDNVVLGRVSAEADLLRWAVDGWIFSARGGGAIIGGQSVSEDSEGPGGGVDLFLGAFLLRRF